MPGGIGAQGEPGTVPREGLGAARFGIPGRPHRNRRKGRRCIADAPLGHQIILAYDALEKRLNAQAPAELGTLRQLADGPES